MATLFLEKSFQKGQVSYDRIVNARDGYIYKVTDNSGDSPTIHYEKFRRKVRPVAGVLLGNPNYEGYDFYEPYPSDEDFGQWAWRYATFRFGKRFWNEQGICVIK